MDAAQKSIQEGTDVGMTDKRAIKPSVYAARNGHTAVMKLLLETGQIDVGRVHEETELLSPGRGTPGDTCYIFDCCSAASGAFDQREGAEFLAPPHSSNMQPRSFIIASPRS